MKKSLLFSAAAMMLAGSVSLQAQQWTTETVWAYSQKDFLCSPVPGLDGGWSGLNNAGATRGATCSRFAVGIDGKILTTDMKANSIIAIDENGVSTFQSLEGYTTIGTKWNGCAITTDDAGHVIFDYNFLGNPGSITEWGVIDNGVITDVTMSTPVANLGPVGAIDCIGHIVGDVTSPEGGIGYATGRGSGLVVMLHFKGDGTKVTSLTGASCTEEIAALKVMGNDAALMAAVPKYATVEEIVNSTYPANCFYATVGRRPWQAPAGAVNIADGCIANFDEDVYAPLTGIGNRMAGGIAVFHHDGETYIVRNYLSPAFLEEYTDYTDGHGVMNYGIFTTKGKCVATWMESEFGNGFGMSSINVEPAGENKYNVYTIYSTGSADNETGTEAGFYCAMTTVTIPEKPVIDIEGAGTEADPYLIATADDLCNAYMLMEEDQVKYFKQTADIDMAGVTDYHAINGFNGGWAQVGGGFLYSSAFVYDGDYHVIKNFAPADTEQADQDAGTYYRSSIFGVLSGVVKNLGVVDANVNSTMQGAAILGVYGGHSQAPAGFREATIENCFVTGKVASDVYAGGMIATTGNVINIKNSYAQVDVKGAAETAGLVSRATTAINLENVYVSGTVAGGENTALVVKQRDGKSASVNATNVYALNTGAESTTNAALTGIISKATAAEAIPEIQKWEAFNGKVMFNELPALNWQGEGEQGGIAGSGTEADPYLIATAEDLCDAWTLTAANTVTYFKQTADIDMAGVTEYHAISGFNGGWGDDRKYSTAIVYDGDYHIIKNFKPADKQVIDKDPELGNNYYCTSIFGVLSGVVKNLGVVDANIVSVNQGAAILGVYGGHGNAPAGFQAATIENCFVTGNVESNIYAGGMIATTGSTVNIKDSYAQVDVKGAAETAGLVSRATTAITLENVFVAGTVAGGENTALVVKQRDGKSASVNATNVYALNTGAESTTNAALTGTIEKATVAEATPAIQAWEAFNAKKVLNGVPTLNWVDAEEEDAGIDSIVADEDENAPVEYYNLQGVRVENPANGLYIKRQGNKATKVIIR